jgi:hypothetical protein
MLILKGAHLAGSASYVRKKAALCLLRLVRVNKDLQLSTDAWKNKLTPMQEEKNLGVVLSVVRLRCPLRLPNKS